MAKTELQRILEKQQKEQQKYAREAQNRERAALLNWLKIIQSVEKQLTTTLCF